jgi:cytidine deaminase
MLQQESSGIPRFGPELFFGLAGAAGTDLGKVSNALTDALGDVAYETAEIRLSELLDMVDWAKIKNPPRIEDDTTDQHIATRMDGGDALRESLGRGDALALLAMLEVSKFRSEALTPMARQAYIFRSLKHPDEVETLREIYGEHFFLISAYSPVDARADHLAREIEQDWERVDRDSSNASPQGTAWNLIERDKREVDRPLGQRLGDTFPKADFFVDARPHGDLEERMRRFIELLFGHPFHTPTRDENAMFHARAAAVRSSAPGRQVGAVLASPVGDVVAIGSNEVPKAGGGQYWADDSPDHRDHTRDDPDVSGTERRTLIEQILNRLRQQSWLTPEHESATADEFLRLTSDLRVQSVIEFERAVHAEMAAIIDAARRGVKVTGNDLYTTTFPCHECTRHIIASGVRRVVYIDPYPKSLAARLHDDALAIDQEEVDDKVLYQPFVGVAPRRYLEFFEMKEGERKPEGRVRAPRAAWLPRLVPTSQSPVEPIGVADSGGEAAEPIVSRPLENSKRAGTNDPQEELDGEPSVKLSEAAPSRESDERRRIDLAQEEEERQNERTSGAPTMVPSDILYIVREANTLLELEEAVEKSELDLKEVVDGNGP